MSGFLGQGKGAIRPLAMVAIAWLFFVTTALAQLGQEAFPDKPTFLYNVHLPPEGILRTHAGELRFEDSPFVVPVKDSEATAAIPRRDIVHEVFRKHRWDFSLEGGRFHNNIPFVFDFLLGDGYNMTGLDYTLAPFIASFRWQLSGVHGHTFFRGTWEGSVSATYTMIPRGPETRYFAYMMGFRRNFVQPNWKVIPYSEFRAGVGNVNAKGPLGVFGAQGQDLAFTLFFGSGFRYIMNERYSLLFGAGYMHISNLYLSEPRFLDYGINVYGPTMGIEVRLGRDREQTVR